MEKAVLRVSSKRLGDGTSATVHVADLNGVPVAAKVSTSREEARRQVRREARRYSRIKQHRNIVKCLGVAESQEAVVLVTELMQGGSLFSELSARKGALLPRDSIHDIAGQLSRAIAHCHTTGFSVGDVKSLNVLLTKALQEDGRLSSGESVKLCDFGLSRRLREDNTELYENESDWLGGTTAGMDPNAIAGTYAYLAPECFEAAPRTASAMMAADVYALGVLLWELATVQVPYAGFSIGALLRAIQNDKRLSFSGSVREHVSDRYVRLVKRMWAREPEKRPSALEVVRTLDLMFSDSSSPITMQAPSQNANVSTEHVIPLPASKMHCTGTSDLSDDSAEIASIVSVDDEIGDDDDGSFEIQLRLLPGVAEEMRQQNQQDGTDSYTSGSESSSDSDDGDVRSYDEDFLVAGELEDFTVLQVTGEGQVSQVEEIPLYGEVTEVSESFTLPRLRVDENCVPSQAPNASISPTRTGKNDDKHVRFVESFVTDIAHVSSPTIVSATTLPLKSISLSSPTVGEFSNNTVKTTKKQKFKIKSKHKMGDTNTGEQDGVYIPDEYPASGLTWLEATNELSEYDYTFQDGCSTASNASTKQPTQSVRDSIIANISRRSTTPLLEDKVHRRSSSGVGVGVGVTSGTVGNSSTRVGNASLSPLSATDQLLKFGRSATSENMYQGEQERVKSTTVRRAMSTPLSVQRTYALPIVSPGDIEMELQQFESEDINADVLSSVMRYRKFVSRIY